MKKAFMVMLVLICVFTSAFANGRSETDAADDYFNESLTFVVHSGAGGNLDIKVRLVAKYLEDIIGKPVIVENVSGGGGSVAATQYLQEKPNTHKILVMGDLMFAIVPRFTDVAYKFDDFIPIVGLDVVRGCMYAKADKIKNYDDLVQTVKSREVLLGDNGQATGSYLSQAAALSSLGAKFRSVTYSTAPETLSSIYAGNIDLGWAAVNVGEQYVMEGQLVPLMVFSEDPYTFSNGVVAPSAKSLGIDVVQENFLFFGIRAGSDKAVVEKIENAIKQVYSNPDFLAEAKRINMVLAPTNSEETKAKLDGMIIDYDKYFNMINQQ